MQEKAGRDKGDCVPVAQWLEHCVSSAKVVGSIPREHTYWQYKCIAWMHCKSLWIKASAKCINVNVVRAIIHHRGMQHPMGKFNCSSHRSTWRGQHSARGSGLHLCIYPKLLTGYTFFCQYMCTVQYMWIEPTTFALLTQCSTTEPQEH